MTVLNLLANGEIGGVEVLCKNYMDISSNANIAAFMWGLGVVGKEIQESGHTVFDMKCSHFNIFDMTKKVIEICDSNDVGCIVSNHTIAAINLCMMVVKKKRPNIKMVFYAQADADLICRAEHAILKPALSIITKTFYKRADLVISISKSVKKSLVSKFGERKKESVIVYNGVPSELFSTKRREGNSIPNLIYVGRLVEDKGVQVALSALAKVNKDYHFKIVGEGPYRNILEKQCLELGLENKVEFLGARRDVSRLLSESDYFIHTPKCAEGFGLTVVEAMAVGLICLVNNRGALPEIVDNGVNGYIAQPSSDAVCEAINRMLEKYESDEEKEMRLKAVEKAKEFSMEIYATKMDSLLG